MKFLKYISIKNKLFINIIIPIVTIVMISTVVIFEHIDKKSKYSNFDTLAQMDAKISLFIHESQKERGATAGFLGSKGEKFTQILSNQREQTNKAIHELKNFIDESSVQEILFENTNSTLNVSLSKLEKINDMRNQVLISNYCN